MAIEVSHQGAHQPRGAARSPMDERPNLAERYDAIGISAVAAAARYSGAREARKGHGLRAPASGDETGGRAGRPSVLRV